MRNFLKKFTLSILLVSVLTSAMFFGAPVKNANAQLATFDGATFGQNVLNVINTTSSSFSTYSLQYKAFVLDTLATMLAKQLIRQLTASVVDWINNGFEGSPSFMTNPGSFFLNVADQFTGEWLSKFGGPLNNLCSGFSIDLRIALAFKFHRNPRTRYTCTLGTIINNTKNAAENASINGQRISGFMNGDFNQGGWPAFVSMTTETSNNVYGAYLSADSELSLQVANAKIEQRDELGQGRGFLSWKKCTQYANDAALTQGATTDWETGDAIVTAGSVTDWETGELKDQSNGGKGKCVKEEVQTPGSVIEESLVQHVGGPVRELELVDSINEIVNALAAQLITQVLQKGLRSVSGSGPSDSSAYLREIQAEANGANNTQLAKVREDFLKNVTTYIKNALLIKTNKDQAWNLFSNLTQSYDRVKACYQAKIDGGSLTEYHKTVANAKIAEINNKISTDVSPKLNLLLYSKQSADAQYTKLTEMETKANTAKTANDVNAVSVEFSQMLQSQSLPSAKDIGDSQTELEDAKVIAGVPDGTLTKDASQKYNECVSFPYTYNDF
jgi:hypothetical protein